MPTYEYRCADCGNNFDIVQAFTDDSLTQCPECSGRLKKVFGSVGIAFKGSGFYVNDSSESKQASPSDSSDSSDSSSGDSSASSESSSSEGGAGSYSDSGSPSGSDSKSSSDSTTKSSGDAKASTSAD